MIDLLLALVEPRGVIAGREQHAFDPVPACRFEQVIAADDIGAQDHLPGTFHREAPEVDDRIHALGDAQHVGHLCNIAGRGCFSGGERLDRFDVRQTQIVLARPVHGANGCRRRRRHR
jgi:hypothetical protein